jgi:peptidoglycan hydrolase-like protein with peptidoglycan-binding domain
MARIPEFNFVQGPKSGYSYRDDDHQWKLLLHTTETPPGTALTLARNHQYSPHFWVDPVTGERYQTIDTGRAAYALRNLRGGVETNADRVIQIEIVGYTAETPHWDEARCRWLGEHVIAPILREHPEIKRQWLGFFPPTQGGNWARTNAPMRLQGAQWDNYSGILGHSHAPENTHVDPGGILIDKIMHYALRAINEPGSPAPTPNPPSKPAFSGDPLTQVIKGGSPADFVRPLQSLLVFWKRLPASGVDGVFGPQTKNAVKGLQTFLQQSGHNPGIVDGVWGPNTYAAYKRWLSSLNNNAPIPAPPAAKNLNSVISQGDRGGLVSELQNLLKTEGVYSGKVDGIYGPQTKAGVRNLQRILNANGHNAGTEDGVWGPKTLGAYKRYKAATPVAKVTKPDAVEQKWLHQGRRHLKNGVRGKDVEEFQFILNIFNDNHPSHFLNVDGVFGPKTEAEVLRFQQAYNIFYDPDISADGIVGSESRYAMARVLNDRGIW